MLLLSEQLHRESLLSVRWMGTRQPVVGHRQADVVVVAVRSSVVGPTDGEDVVL